ncbi:hypothetical protein HU200_000039 [Digitaria exilis]|uniref:Uncharacterized protein n=1 Tax=Digitaria exilis TaxID=1010633 RepID=A0A835G2W4_9POAL|nr:hypothetical protein HU200_000039 [Digitaria exilis]
MCARSVATAAVITYLIDELWHTCHEMYRGGPEDAVLENASEVPDGCDMSFEGNSHKDPDFGRERTATAEAFVRLE